MSYKMVCIDMDGTLLSKRKTISDESKKVIKEVNEKGIKVVVTTGRLYNNAAYYSNFIGASDAVIAGNGAVIREKNSDEIIFQSDIDINVCKRLLIIAKKCGIILHMHTMNEILTNSYISNVIARVVLPGIKDSDFPIKITTIKGEDNWDNELKNYKGKITKCITFSVSPKKTEMFRKELDNIKEIVYYCSGHRSIEINAKGVSKGNGVKILAEHYGISRDEIICIGDNENDISMIEYAGLGIAMGNGIEKLKEKANYITDTNDNDGVRKALEKFILKIR
ncbi:Cof-type HAD-IIB family hydrolase [Eubacterium multiforme]|uniref:Cof subfamily protein (Haloacid dehalogenase superfamily) n=1 Tax=Eubacterium multiforme TaxID=83339 RepID=A0ABT9UW04_9FIRM|nr:Cof-type HAD-IIB family hydrolase [Eubacterium multiforme]MDQ0150510.1 Cof subfamily protein (haloacid dehalogenase superfamily) [Eubacterium multiforme]